MTRFAVSIVVINDATGLNVNLGQHTFMVEAASRYEAAGKGDAVAKKLWPGKRFWVDTCSEDKVIDPEKATLSTAD
jgi:hypothetical protein